MYSNSILKNITDLADKLDPDRASDNYPKTRDPNYSIEVALDRIADILDPEHAIEIEDKQKDPNYSIEASIQRICEHWPEGGGEMTVFDLYKDYHGVYSKLWPVIEDFYDKSQADMRNFIARGSAKIIDSDWTKLKIDLTTAITESITIFRNRGPNFTSVKNSRRKHYNI